jgi:hypothetical protein
MPDADVDGVIESATEALETEAYRCEWVWMGGGGMGGAVKSALSGGARLLADEDALNRLSSPMFYMSCCGKGCRESVKVGVVVYAKQVMYVYL